MAHHSKLCPSWWEGVDLRADAHITPTVRKQREMNAATWLNLSFSDWDPQPREWCSPYIGWVFPSKLTYSGNSPTRLVLGDSQPCYVGSMVAGSQDSHGIRYLVTLHPSELGSSKQINSVFFLFSPWDGSAYM